MQMQMQTTEQHNYRATTHAMQTYIQTSDKQDTYHPNHACGMLRIGRQDVARCDIAIANGLDLVHAVDMRQVVEF